MNEQIDLFADVYKNQQQMFAEKICDELNKLDTVFKGTFYVEKCSLAKWDHVPDAEKVLEITIKSPLNNRENRFIQLAGDEKSQLNLYNAGVLSDYLGKLSEDKDFSMAVTPWSIYVFYHKFERKKV